ncbi:MAG: tRNA pseudouridine55 synthase [Alphaproteobacteria bacterium]|jgi:tRNA pseudouridine55 synthase
MARNKKGRDVSGWIILDKPRGVTSTHAVARIKRIFDATKVGHAGTLDPLATGILPIALGEATKTVSYAVDDEKAYRFTVRWGIATTTDDTEGDATNTSDSRPSITDIEAVLPQFVGAIEQVPPKFSAIKVNGNRAYDLARGGQDVELKSRIVQISDLSIEETPDADHTTFAAICGKGTYVRSLARDIGGILGCFGHISDLRRTRVGPFNTENCTTFEELEAALEQDKAGDEPATVARDDMLLPVEAALNGLEHLSISSLDASRLIRGQSVLMRGRDAPIFVGTAYATSRGKLIALVDCDRGTLRPTRVFNLGG